MIRLICGDNVMEYTGDGWFQCGDYVNCPKKENQKCLGFDCFTYIDNIPEKLLNIDVNQKRDIQKECAVLEIHEPHECIIRPTDSIIAIEQIRQHVTKRHAIEHQNTIIGGDVNI